MDAPTDNKEVLELLPRKRLNVTVHNAHFIGGEAFNQRWSLVLPIYQLCRTPSDLLKILEGCAPEQSRSPKLVQMTEQALVYLLPPGNGLYWNDEKQCYRHKLSLNISTGRSSRVETKVYNVHIMGTSPSATAGALLKLLRFPANELLTIELGNRSDLMTPPVMQQVLCECGGSFREYLFTHQALSSDECYRLARHAFKLVFYECIFLDSGAAFLRGVQERETTLSLAFLGRDLPFPNLVPFLRDAKLCELELREGFPLSKADCQALADARVESLTLDKCRLEDHGKALFMVIASGKGPVHLRLTHWDDPEQLDPWLVSALCSEQCQLQSMSLTGSEELPTLASWQTVLQAIFVENTSLRSLELDSFHLTDAHWDILLRALDRNTTIFRLQFQNMASAGSDENEHIRMTRSCRLAEIVQRNRNIEEFAVKGDCPFDQVMWDTQIAPCVLDNRYRNRFRKLQRDHNGVAILAHALARQEVQQEISYMFILLESSVNLLTTYQTNNVSENTCE